MLKILVAIFGVVLQTTVAAASIEQQRLDFLRAELQLSQNKIPEFLQTLESLREYPLYSYLKYQWLKNDLSQTEVIQAFLKTHPNTRSAERLRNKWLLDLAERGQWTQFIANYATSKYLDLRCYYLQAQLTQENKAETQSAIKDLWLAEADFEEECPALMRLSFQKVIVDSDWLWRRFDRLLWLNKSGAAASLLSLFDQTNQIAARNWLNLHHHPEKLNANGLQVFAPALQAKVFTEGVRSLMRIDVSAALEKWKQRPEHLLIDDARRRDVEHDLALGLAKANHPAAFEYLMKVQNSDEDINEWRVRSALQDRNWQQVLTAIASFDSATQQQSKWQYWKARAYWLLEQRQFALDIFKTLSHKRDYYGFLAADFSENPYQLEDQPISISPAVSAEIAQSEPIKVIEELRHHGRNQEASAEWWYWLAGLSNDRALAAAKLAQQWNWHPIDIFTSVKADHWNDVNLRFPLVYQDLVSVQSQKYQLNPVLVYGLIRQESAFDERAQSAVGARGLMQIMPTTASQIAKELGEVWNNKDSLYLPELNIRYGAYYYAKLSKRFDQHYALAAAAYNAGPHRVNSWLPLKSTPADVWIETIPFKETRKYVSAVLSNAIIYQQRLGTNAIKLKDLMPEIKPLKI